MNQLIVVEQGQDGVVGQLSGDERVQITALAKRLKDVLLNETTVLVIASPVERDRESAEILAAALRVVSKQCEVSWLADFFPGKFPETLELVEMYENEAEVLVLVTPYEHEYVETFAEYWARKKKIRSNSQPSKRCRASVLDYSRKVLIQVKPS